MNELSEEERERYGWQMTTPDVGEAGQQKLKAASVLVTRVGGVGGAAAYYLAAAGVGKLVLAHAGPVRLPDLNRQILMTTDGIGELRVASAARRLRELNPNVEIETVSENPSSRNAADLVSRVDLILNAAPLFEERLALNEQVVRQCKPMVDCAMYDFDLQLTTILPGQTPCLACLHPLPPAQWKREFPVFGAVAGVAGTIGAVEAIKVITGIGQPLAGRMLVASLRDMSFRTMKLQRDAQCSVCRDV